MVGRSENLSRNGCGWLRGVVHMATERMHGQQPSLHIRRTTVSVMESSAVRLQACVAVRQSWLGPWCG